MNRKTVTLLKKITTTPSTRKNQAKLENFKKKSETKINQKNKM
jgi:hypothetical protein